MTAVTGGNGGGLPWRAILWGGAAALVALPAVAMQFTSEVNWTASDFVFAVVVIGGAGLLSEAAVRMSRNPFYRAGVAFALAAAFLIIWATAAVGMIGDEENPYNLWFFGAIALALAGAVASRFRAGGMAVAAAVAGAAQAAVALGGFSADPRGAAISAGLAGLWLIAAALFHRAARAPGGR